MDQIVIYLGPMRSNGSHEVFAAVTGPCPRTGGPHRWAWLVDGSQACGYCEKPRV